MWSRIVQKIWCRGCPLEFKYPNCAACDYKAEFDETEVKISVLWGRSFFAPNPFFQSPQHEHPSRWREERRSRGKTIRIPLVYG